jgi:cephalosporin-C deacetylase-like acetyl esterase
MTLSRPLLIACFSLLSAFPAYAATPIAPVPAHASSRVATVKIGVAPDHPDWTYRPGEHAKFTVSVMADDQPLAGVTITYKVGPEMLPTQEKTAVVSANGSFVIDGGTLQQPGFIRCSVTAEFGGKEYRGLATAGFAPEKIQPTQTEPADFDAFWEAGKAELAKVPLEPQITLMPEACTAAVNVYHVSVRTVGTAGGGQSLARVYGILCEPKAPGKYPAVLRVPGAGVRPYSGSKDVAARGVITLDIGIHGIPVNLPPELYDQLRTGGLEGYNRYNLDNKDLYYYRRVYLSCVRANDFLTSREMYDGQNLVVIGGSQGGQLTLVTTALDPRVKGLAAQYPAYCDVTGYLHGRAGGWPHMFRPDGKTGENFHATPAKITTTSYYDAVNFAKRVKVPGHYTWGYNDEVCPPTSIYAAFNQISAPKELVVALEATHSAIPEQSESVRAWLGRFLKLAK